MADEKGAAKRTYWVLSLDGGGVRGVYSATVLCEIGKILGKPIEDCFDLFVGTSAGALIAISLAQSHKMSPNINLHSLFSHSNSKKIFDKSCWDSIFPVQAKPRYDGKGKRAVIKSHLYIKTLEELRAPTVIATYDITCRDTKLFRSWDLNDAKKELLDVADATSAAPTYFPCVEIGDHAYIDGGVAVNNPCLVALQEARHLWGNDADIRMLSIGTGIEEEKPLDGDDAEDWGLPRWLYHGLVDIMMDAPRDIMGEVCYNLMPKGTFYRINTKMKDAHMDDTSGEYRNMLLAKAEETLKDHKKNIISFFNGHMLQDADSIETVSLNSTGGYVPLDKPEEKKKKCTIL